MRLRMEGGEQRVSQPEDTDCASPPAAPNQEHLSQHMLLCLSHIPQSAGKHLRCQTCTAAARLICSSR